MSIPDDDYGPTGGEGAPRGEAAPEYQPGGGSLIPEARSGRADPTRSMAQTELDDALARARVAEENAADEAREASARALEHLTWEAADGVRLCVLWTAGRQAKMDTLEEAAGLLSVPEMPLTDGNESAQIFLFLATNTEDTWEAPRPITDPVSGRRVVLPPLAANIPLFLQHIRAWADDEFHPFSPGTNGRLASAREMLYTVRRMIADFRPEELPDENEPNSEPPKK